MAPDRAEQGGDFSRPVAVERIPARGLRLEVEADAAERAALAARLDLAALSSLSAEVELKPLAGPALVRVWGRLTATLTQTCGVTLAPLPAAVVEAFDLTFAPAEDVALDEGDEIELSWDRQDPPDPIVDGVIDIGAVVAEHLALALDPFPRAPDAAFQPPPDLPESPPERVSPFAALSKLRQKGGGG